MEDFSVMDNRDLDDDAEGDEEEEEEDDDDELEESSNGGIHHLQHQVNGARRLNRQHTVAATVNGDLVNNFALEEEEGEEGTLSRARAVETKKKKRCCNSDW